MSRLLLVRHGKAADHWNDYDHLSEAGARQAEHLAQRLLREETVLAAAYHGTMRRQRQTAEVVARVFAEAGRPFPALRELPGLDEIHPGVVDAALLAEEDLAVREHVTAWITGKAKGTRETRSFLFAAFQRFARDELAGDFEKYPVFHARVTTALAAMVDVERGTAVAFTSGGFIATAAGFAIQAALDPTLRLMATLENASLTEIRHSRSRDAFSLVRLNDVGHVPLEARTLL